MSEKFPFLSPQQSRSLAPLPTHTSSAKWRREGGAASLVTKWGGHAFRFRVAPNTEIAPRCVSLIICESYPWRCSFCIVFFCLTHFRRSCMRLVEKKKEKTNMKKTYTTHELLGALNSRGKSCSMCHQACAGSKVDATPTRRKSDPSPPRKSKFHQNIYDISTPPPHTHTHEESRPTPGQGQPSYTHVSGSGAHDMKP